VQPPGERDKTHPSFLIVTHLTWYHPQNRKYIIHCTIVTRQRRTERQLRVQKIWWNLEVWFLRYTRVDSNVIIRVDRQTDNQTNKQTNRQTMTCWLLLLRTPTGGKVKRQLNNRIICYHCRHAKHVIEITLSIFITAFRCIDLTKGIGQTFLRTDEPGW